jgi:glycosyltransferase involved in cell wall biosynthesis
MKLSIIIPFYNEEKTVREIIEKVKHLKLPITREIIVVDDGSKDNSFEQVRNIKGIKLLRHEKNLGKGAAVRTALKHATGDIVIIQDADLELNPEEIINLIKPLIERKADVVYGSRLLSEKKVEHSFFYYLGGRFVTFFTNLLYGTKLTDEPCGYKAFKTDILRKIGINENRFEFEPEITAKIAKIKVKITEMPVSYHPRTKKQGKKINWKDGIRAILTLIKYRFKK